MDPNSPSLSEPPPPAAAESHPADQLNSHPLWNRAAGRGNMGPPPARGARGRGRGRGAAPAAAEEDSGVRYERISLLAVELSQAATEGDGAESEIDLSDEEREQEHDYDDQLDEDEADRLSAIAGSEDGFRRKKPNQAGGSSAADMLAAAAFGGRSRALDEQSDVESMASRTSSKRKRDAFKDAFPVRGVRCVGCSLVNRIGPVKNFVNKHITEMREDALWRNAARVWQNEVMQPARREGVEVVDWPWRAIAAHFKLHTTNAVIGRTNMIQSLMAMRMRVEGQVVRNENGERTVDKANADLALKIAAAESKERLLLAQCIAPNAGRGGGKGGQRPAGEE